MGRWQFKLLISCAAIIHFETEDGAAFSAKLGFSLSCTTMETQRRRLQEKRDASASARSHLAGLPTADHDWTQRSSPLTVARMKRAVTQLLRPQVDFATQDRMVNGFSR